MPEKNAAKFVGWITLALAALTCGTIAFAISQGPKTVTIDEIADRNASFDPQIGSKIKLGRHIGKRTIVVALGSCTSCSISKTNFSWLKDLKGHSVVAFYEKGAAVKQVTEGYPWLKAYEDTTGLHAQLNAYQTPRAYAIGPEGDLLALQQPTESLDRFLRRAGAMP